MEPIVEWVVEIGIPKTEEIINHIAVEINMVKAIASVISIFNKSLPTVSLTPLPKKNAPNIAKIVVSIRISFIIKVLDPWTVAKVSSLAPIANAIKMEIRTNTIIIMDINIIN